jgi:hypothetical protein
VWDLDGILGKGKNRIQRVGVELEGAWPAKMPRGTTLEKDASVKPYSTDPYIRATQMAAFPNVGELVSEPYLPVSVFRWMRQMYPGLVNHTCGMHVHMSFDHIKRYMQLMHPNFLPTVVYYLGEWAHKEGFPAAHHIWSRLAGKSEFCNHSYDPDLQAQTQRKDFDHFRKGNRYSGVAYRFRLHRTIEVRFLPMMDEVEQAMRAVKYVLDITNAALVATAEREPKYYEIVPKREGNDVDVTIETILI